MNDIDILDLLKVHRAEYATRDADFFGLAIQIISMRLPDDLPVIRSTEKAPEARQRPEKLPEDSSIKAPKMVVDRPVPAHFPDILSLLRTAEYRIVN